MKRKLKHYTLEQLTKELSDAGWEVSEYSKYVFYNEKFGTHNIFKAVKLQRECDKICSRSCIIVVLGLMCLIYIGSCMIGWISKCLGGP